MCSLLLQFSTDHSVLDQHTGSPINNMTSVTQDIYHCKHYSSTMISNYIPLLYKHILLGIYGF